MKFLTKLERKFGQYAIPNMTFLMIIGFIVGFIILVIEPEAISVINLNPEKIFHGEVWRLVTWIVIPPNMTILIIITLMFYFSIGRQLEQIWGDFRYNLYLISGIVFTDLGIIIGYVISLLIGQGGAFTSYSSGISTYYICMSLFLAYAFIFPDHKVLLWFIIPVKMKWLGYLDIAYLLYYFVIFGIMHFYAGMIMIVMSILNFVVFYIMTKSEHKISKGHKKRKRKYTREVRSTQILTRHKCAICGQTEEDNPQLEFRYCSRCKGNYEYCNQHLFTHEHKNNLR